MLFQAIRMIFQYVLDLIITAGGENIPLNLIEERIKEEIPMISNCILIGDEHRFLAVLLTIKVSRLICIINFCLKFIDLT